jgi:hypothetical protein
MVSVVGVLSLSREDGTPIADLKFFWVIDASAELVYQNDRLKAQVTFHVGDGDLPFDVAAREKVRLTASWEPEMNVMSPSHAQTVRSSQLTNTPTPSAQSFIPASNNHQHRWVNLLAQAINST